MEIMSEIATPPQLQDKIRPPSDYGSVIPVYDCSRGVEMLEMIK